jgi:ketosteroid isomerase-like protein
MNAGLCDTCRHQSLIRNTRGSSFSRCERSKTDPGYPKYPRLPVMICAGHERWPNVDLVRAVYDRFRGGDPEGALSLYDPEVEVHDRPELPDPRVYRGHEGVLASLDASRAEFAGFDLVPEEFVDAGDRVIVVFRFLGTGRESGVPIEERLCHSWTVRDGRVIRMEVHSDREAALRGT